MMTLKSIAFCLTGKIDRNADFLSISSIKWYNYREEGAFSSGAAS
jgi:hypothetical protein